MLLFRIWCSHFQKENVNMRDGTEQLRDRRVLIIIVQKPALITSQRVSEMISLHYMFDPRGSALPAIQSRGTKTIPSAWRQSSDIIRTCSISLRPFQWSTNLPPRRDQPPARGVELAEDTENYGEYAPWQTAKLVD